MAKNSLDLIEALRSLLQRRKATTQENICIELEKQGYEINQSKASRLLRKVGAIKIVNTLGQNVYSLPREPAPPSMNTPLRDLILDIVSNETLVVLFTSPGSASMVARILDYHQVTTEILGTIAGDDTVFITPKSTKNIQKLLKEIKNLLQE
ncbi:MAG: Arginine repressor [Chlamydiae bacterium]|nr:Arginine repressor [Chlamydiota bacterium]